MSATRSCICPSFLSLIISASLLERMKDEVKTKLFSDLFCCPSSFPSSFPQKFLEPLDNFWRLRDHLFGQRFKLFASDRFDRPSPLFCFCQKLCIFDCFIPRLTQDSYSLGKDSRWSSYGTAKDIRCQDDCSQAPPSVGCFVLVH